MKTKPQILELSDLSDGWDICRERGKPVKGRHDGRLYWFYPSGHLRMLKPDGRVELFPPKEAQ